MPSRPDREEQGDNIFITVTAERARKEAEAAERRYRAGTPLSALDGVPIGWKDIIDIAGTPTTAGSKVLGDGPVKTSGPPLRRQCREHRAW